MADTATASATIKTWFETGDVPTQQQFADFITSYANLVDNNQKDGVVTGITAFAGGGQASATALVNRFNRIDTCATELDSVKLPTLGVSTVVFAINNGLEPVAVYPQSGGEIYGQGVNGYDILPRNYYVMYVGINSSVWLKFKWSYYGTYVDYSDSTQFLRTLGSDIKAQALMGFEELTAATALGNQTVYYIPIQVKTAFQATGGYIYQAVQGDYTADNYNGIGLYSLAAGVLTLIASSADDGDIWKATSQTWIKKAFSSPVIVEPGVYYLAILYCRSAQVTAPSIARGDALYNSSVNVGLFTDSNKYLAQLAAQTSLTTPINMSGLTQSVHNYYGAIY